MRGNTKRKVKKTYYVDGVAFSTMKEIADSSKYCYETIRARFFEKDSFILGGVFFTVEKPEFHERERLKAENKQWRKEYTGQKARRIVNGKPAPLLGLGHITHGINNGFGR